MTFENLQVGRVVLHEVYKRRHDGALVQPRYATQLIVLPPAAMDVFKERVVDAMGAESQSMAMTIADASAGSAVAIAASLVGRTDAQFVSGAGQFADKLAAAQIARNLPGGILIVFDGTVTAASHPVRWSD